MSLEIKKQISKCHMCVIMKKKKKKETFYLKRKCTLVFNAALFAIVKMWNQPKYRLIVE